MVKFSNLPDELIMRIVEDFYHDQIILAQEGYPASRTEDPLILARKALIALCLVNHRFRSISQPVLWRYLGCCTESPLQAMDQLCTAIETPRLASYIYEVNMYDAFRDARGYAGGDGPSSSVPKVLTEEQSRRMETAVRALKVDFADTWAEHIQSRPEEVSTRNYTEKHQEAIIALCLAFLPRLREIRFAWPKHPAPLLEQLPEARDIVPGLKTLELLMIMDYDYSEPWGLKKGMNLFTLPSIRRFAIRAVLQEEDFELAAGSIASRSAYFDNVILSKKPFTTLVNACARLERFCWTRAMMLKEAWPYSILPHELVDALSRHQDSLKILLLDSRNYVPNRDRPGGTIPPIPVIPTFHHFAVLEDLDIDQATFVDQTDTKSLTTPEGTTRMAHILLAKLPQSLQRLAIVHAETDLVGVVQRWASLLPAKMPSLGKLQIAPTIKRDWQPFEELHPHYDGTAIAYSVFQRF